MTTRKRGGVGGDGLPEEKPEKIPQLDTRCRCYSKNNETGPHFQWIPGDSIQKGLKNQGQREWLEDEIDWR